MITAPPALRPDVRVFLDRADRFEVVPLDAFPAGTSTQVVIGTARRLSRRAWIAVVAGASLGIALGAMAALHGDKPAPPPATILMSKAPAPAPAPTVRPLLVTVRIESMPTGAVVSLLEDRKAATVGTTPIDVELDPSRAYDVMVASSGFVARTEHVDPARVQHVVVELSPARVLRAPAAGPASDDEGIELDPPREQRVHELRDPNAE